MMLAEYDRQIAPHAMLTEYDRQLGQQLPSIISELYVIIEETVAAVEASPVEENESPVTNRRWRRFFCCV